MEVKDAVFDEIFDKVLFREKQVSTLLSQFNTRNSFSCGSIFIYGHTATGKNYVLETLFEKLELPNIFVNCVECFNARLMFEHILNQLQQIDNKDCNQDTEFARCDNMNDFIRAMRKNVTAESFGKETLFIVIDKCERLRDMEVNLLPTFLRLNELTGGNICVVFISEIIFEKFRHGTGFREPFQMHFPDYSKTELLEIMCLDAPEEHPKEFYHGYCQLLLSVFHNVCRDLKELRHLARLNFPKYCEPITNKDANYSDVKKLWRNIEPHLRKAMSTVFLREVSSSQWEQIQEGTHGVKGLSSYSTVELPFYSKYLLIAAYLASHNPAKTDRQFFCKTTAKKMSKRAKVAAKTGVKTSSQLKGPHQFVLDRLMAIFYSIVDEKVPASAVILSQLSSLVTLRFLSQVSANDQLDSPKYKCLVSLDLVKAIARQLEFDLGHYLYDFINQ